MFYRVNRAPVAFAVLLTALPGAGEQVKKRTFSFESASAAECPAVSSFSWRVLARTSRAELLSTPGAEVDFALSVAINREGAVGTLEVRKGKEHTARHVRGASCEEVVDGLALVAAVILDPNASTGPIAGTPPAPATSTSEAASSEGGTSPPASQAPAPGPTPAREEAPVEETRAHSMPLPGGERGPSGRWRFGAGGRALVTSGVAPRPVVGWGAYLSALFDTEGAAFAPEASLGFSAAESSGYETRLGSGELGTASFRWLAGDLTLCPFRLPPEGSVSARPCVGFELGRLTAAGSAPKNSAEATATWRAVMAGVKLAWGPIEWLRLDLFGGGFVSLSEDRFYFDLPPSAGGGQSVAHEIPPFGVRAALSAGLVLP